MAGLWIPRPFWRPVAEARINWGDPLLSGLGAWYVFGQTGAPVSMLPNHVGIESGSPVRVADVRYGDVIRFDPASSQNYGASTSPIATTVTTCTLTARVHFTALAGSNQTIVAVTDVSNASRRISVDVTAAGVFSVVQRATTYTSTTATPVGRWVDVAVVVIGSAYRALYVDGRQVLVDTGGNSSHALNQTRVGSARSSDYLSADVMEARVYTRALLPSEIERLADPSRYFDHWTR